MCLGYGEWGMGVLGTVVGMGMGMGAGAGTGTGTGTGTGMGMGMRIRPLRPRTYTRGRRGCILALPHSRRRDRPIRLVCDLALVIPPLNETVE